MFMKMYPLIAVSLFFFSSIFSQTESDPCCPKARCAKVCDPVQVCTMKPAYNAPARIAVQGCWDVFTTGSFLYWIPSQENMELGFVSDTTTTPLLDADYVKADLTYKPGFKVGIGMNLDYDHWDTYLEYTWFHGSQRTNLSLDSSGTKILHPYFIFPDATSSTYSRGNQDWQLRLDLLDFRLARHYHLGTALSFHPFLGLRAGWIRQNLNNGYFGETTGLISFPSVSVTQTSSSWGIGPRIGVESDWLLGQGVRLYGTAAGDVLFSQYTRLNFSQVGTDASGVSSDEYLIRQRDLSYLRGHFDSEIGLGWGMYLDCNRWHVDFTAGYCFQLFFNQNMFRNFVDDVTRAKSLCPNGDLFIHGLTLTARLDF